MFNKDIEKLNFIVENISNIEEIIKRHDGIVNALKDKVEARPAILMAFLQIGETLNKLQNTYEALNIDDIFPGDHPTTLLRRLPNLPVKNRYSGICFLNFE